MLICDFCSGHPITARYDADDFVADEVTVEDGPTRATLYVGSEGAWAACQTCEELIDAGEWDLLLSRAVYEFYVRWPDLQQVMPTETLVAHLKQMYKQLTDSHFKKVPL